MEQEQLKEEELSKKSKKDNTAGRKTPRVKENEKAGSAKDKKDHKKDDSKDVKKEDKKDSKKPSSSGRKSRARSSSKSPAESVVSATVPPVEDRQELHPPEEPFHVREAG